jgi:hypothetical protein
MLTVMQSIMDTNRSYLDVKEELFMFIDTIQSRAEFHPDPEISVGSNSFADLLAQLLLQPERDSQKLQIHAHMSARVFVLPLNGKGILSYNLFP